MRRARLALFCTLLCLLAFAGCDGCSAAGRLRVDGDHPYVRCVAADDPGEATWTVGDIQVQRADRRLTITGGDGPLRMAALMGPGPGELGASAAALPETLDRAAGRATWVLGELGDSEGAISATLQALAQHDGISLVLTSGRDDMNVVEAAFDALDEQTRQRVIDMRPIRSVTIGDEHFLPLSGAPAGRYARSENACGFGDDDLSALFDDAPEGRRWLISWAAPAGGVSRGEAGDGGSPLLATAMENASVTGGIFGWPGNQALRPVEPGPPPRELGEREGHASFQMTVARVGGPRVVRADGSLTPASVAVVEVREAGMALLELIPVAEATTPTESEAAD